MSYFLKSYGLKQLKIRLNKKENWKFTFLNFNNAVVEMQIKKICKSSFHPHRIFARQKGFLKRISLGYRPLIFIMETIFKKVFYNMM